MTRRTLTVDEAADQLGISRATAYAGIKSNQIPHIKIGRRILVPITAMNKLVGANEDENKIETKLKD